MHNPLSVETVANFILHCPVYEQERSILFSYVNEAQTQFNLANLLTDPRIMPYVAEYSLLEDEYNISQASKLLNFNHWPSNLTTWRTRLGTVKSANVKLHAHIHTHTHTESANLVFFVVNSTGMKDICDKVLKNYTLQSIRLLTKANQWYLQIEYREILPSFVFFLHAPGVI